MPLVKCTKNGRPGYKWGKRNSSCFTYTPGNAASRRRARERAMKQAVAMGEVGKQTRRRR